MSDQGGNRIRDLLALGQSVWLDSISRNLIESGDLRRLIEGDGLRGMTSNPSIFEKAVSGAHAYDAEIEALAREGLDASAIFDRLAIADVGSACDAFLPVYEESGGADGFVSIEVAPRYAYDAATTLTEARRLFAAVGRPNVMIKIPGTAAGLPAIHAAVGEGINVNVTLLFSVGQYEAIAEAFIAGLEGRVAAGGPVDRVASVASFFVSRIDTLVDGWLESKADEGACGAARGRVLGLRGLLGVANSKIAYERFQGIVAAERWRRLAAAGARVQRMLWASTSTKNPAYDELLYVDPLIGPHTVNTLPEATYAAFKDHGTVARTVDRDVSAAHEHLRALAAAGINVDDAAEQLQAVGVELFVKSFDGVVGIVEQRRAALQAGS